MESPKERVVMCPASTAKKELHTFDKISMRTTIALIERVQELERAVSVLARSNSNWALNVSNDDEFLIDRLLRSIDYT